MKEREIIELSVWIAALVYLDTKYNLISLTTWQEFFENCKGITNSKPKGNMIKE